MKPLTYSSTFHIKPKPPKQPFWQFIEELTADIPPEILDTLPTDGAEQHDHYLYGTSKH